ncbi:MAG TPA: hypothetical protein VGS80_18260 [Ktedonobacterales bacterium]|jgi:DNA-binding response OmpR family regulator|nr:hypothetical protein [Ktedonobacterales bacterium]
MAYTPAFDTLDSVEPLAAAAVDLKEERRPTRRPTPRASLRFGGFQMDPLTGATSWGGRSLTLSAGDRQLLAVLLRRGGQIVSREYLATALGTTVRAMEERVERLTTMLKHEGVRCLPCQVDGLGYVLWRC